MIIAPERPDAETFQVTVLKVFDGDGFLTRMTPRKTSIDRKVVVRCGFIDALEMEQLGGNEAQAFLSSLIMGRRVDLAILLKEDTGRIVDRHGRIVCVPYLVETTGEHAGRSRNIELEMVRNGWA